MLISSACATSGTETVIPASEFCLIATGISYSQPHGAQVDDASNKYDTAETVQQVIRHNLAYERICRKDAGPDEPTATPHSH